MRNILRNKLNSEGQFIFFQNVLVLGDLVVWTYYMVLLLRASNRDPMTVFTNQGILYVGLTTGLFIGSLLLNRLGYQHLFRLSYLLLSLVTLLTLVTLPTVIEVHLVMAVLRGLVKGIFYAGQNVFNLREIHGLGRGRVVSIMLTGNILLQVLLPVLIGSLIVGQGYEITFVLGIILYALAALLPWDINKKPRAVFMMAELWNVAKKTGFKRWAGISFSTQMLANMREQLLTVIPFMYFFSNEFDLGVFQSLVALVGATILFTHRNDKLKKKINLGYLGGFVTAISTAVLSFIWTFPALAIRSLLTVLGYSYYSPVVNEIEYRNKELLLSDFIQESSVELMVFNEIIYLAARLTNLIILVLAFYALGTDTEHFLRTLLLITAIYEVLNLWLNEKLGHILKH